MKRLLYIWQDPRWPRFHWKADVLMPLLGDARLAQGRLLQKAASLGFELAVRSQVDVWVEEAVKTAAIEGQTLSPASVRSSVARRLGLPTAGLPVPERAVEGLVDVLEDATVRYTAPLTVKRFFSWQAALFPTGYSGLHRIRTGGWRGSSPMRIVSGPLGREAVHYEAPPAKDVPAEMRRFLRWWERESRGMDGLLRAGLAHYYFVVIHPFEDGNGRIARALTDMALAQDEKSGKRFYSLSYRIMRDRPAYYAVLERQSRGTPDVTLWLEWFLRCFGRALTDSEGIIGRSLHIAAFWQKHGTAPLHPRQRKALNKMLEALPSGYEGGLTTRKYIGMTGASRATAFREISEMVARGLLRPLPGKGRNAAYALAE